MQQVWILTSQAEESETKVPAFEKLFWEKPTVEALKEFWSPVSPLTETLKELFSKLVEGDIVHIWGTTYRILTFIKE